MAENEYEPPRIPESALRYLMGKKTHGKGTTLYSIVSAQAGGISDAILRGLAGAKLDAFKTVIDDYLTWYDELFAEQYKKKTTKELLNAKEIIYDWLLDDGKFLIDSWKAGLGLQMGTAFMGAIETYMGYPQLLSVYKSTQIDQAIRPILERHWASTYPNNIPDVRTAFQMFMEGKISRAEFNDYCLKDGWATEWHDKLYAVFDTDPNIYMAFTMRKRGLITDAEMNRCFSIAGYDASWHAKLFSALHRRPTFRELTSLADFVQLPIMWVAEVLRAQGYAETDIPYITKALALRPLRDEVRSLAGRYVWDYQIGRVDRDALKILLEKLGLLKEEVSLWLQWADLRYADELIDESLEVLEARVQAGDPSVQTEDDIFTELIALGILSEKANLIAELWYYQYIYTSP